MVRLTKTPPYSAESNQHNITAVRNTDILKLPESPSTRFSTVYVKGLGCNVAVAYAVLFVPGTDEHFYPNLEPIVDFLYETTEGTEYRQDLAINTVMDRRVGMTTNSAIPSETNSDCTAKQFVQVFRDASYNTQKTRVEWGRRLTRFLAARGHTLPRPTSFIFGGDLTHEGPFQPPIHHLLDCDIILVIRCLYSTTSVREFLSHEPAVKDFFGADNYEYGRNVLQQELLHDDW